MSYISTSDAALFPSRSLPVASNAANRRVSAAQPKQGWPVGAALEFVLLVATSSAVSLVLCTAVAGALLG